MSSLDTPADKAVRDAVDAFMEGRLTPEFSGETVFETKNSRYRLLDGVVFAAPDDSLLGAELVGWLMETSRRSVVGSAWQPGAQHHRHLDHPPPPLGAAHLERSLHGAAGGPSPQPAPASPRRGAVRAAARADHSVDAAPARGRGPAAGCRGPLASPADRPGQPHATAGSGASLARPRTSASARAVPSSQSSQSPSAVRGGDGVGAHLVRVRDGGGEPGHAPRSRGA